MTRPDLVGQRFSRLVVVSALPEKRCEKRMWLCRCDCGGEARVSTGGLRAGTTRSCGCLYRETRGEQTRTHGLTGTPEYRVWKHMITRCENPRRTFYYCYGARGIRVCPEWRHDFPRFLKDMGPRPSPKHTIDRIDNDGNYCKENCRWATMRENCGRTRKAILVSFDGETHCVSEWARRLGRSKATIAARFRAGLPLTA